MLVRVLGPADAAAFRAQRIRALREHPDAFRRTPEEVDSVEVWTERLRVDAGSDVDFLLGAFDADALVGTVGCHDGACTETVVESRVVESCPPSLTEEDS